MLLQSFPPAAASFCFYRHTRRMHKQSLSQASGNIRHSGGERNKEECEKIRSYFACISISGPVLLLSLIPAPDPFSFRSAFLITFCFSLFSSPSTRLPIYLIIWCVHSPSSLMHQRTTTWMTAGQKKTFPRETHIRFRGSMEQTSSTTDYVPHAHSCSHSMITATTSMTMTTTTTIPGANNGRHHITHQYM